MHHHPRRRLFVGAQALLCFWGRTMTGLGRPSAAPDGGEPLFVVETLAWCNEQRAEKREPPLDRLPRGTHSGFSCPCGAATGLYVGTEHAWEPERRVDSSTWIELPSGVRAFVKAFDLGHLPQYEA